MSFLCIRKISNSASNKFQMLLTQHNIPTTIFFHQKHESFQITPSRHHMPFRSTKTNQNTYTHHKTIHFPNIIQNPLQNLKTNPIPIHKDIHVVKRRV